MVNTAMVAMFKNSEPVKDTKRSDKTTKNNDFSTMFVQQNKKTSLNSSNGSTTDDKTEKVKQLGSKQKEIKQLFKEGKIARNKSQKSDESNIIDNQSDDLEVQDDITKKFEALCENIVQLIAKHFNISTDDVQTSMEQLGIKQTDLLDIQSITKLVADLKGTTDVMSLLTQSDGSDILKSIMNELNNFVTDFQSELGINQDEFQNLVQKFLLNQETKTEPTKQLEIPEKQQDTIPDTLQETSEETTNATIKEKEIPLDNDAKSVQDDNARVNPQQSQDTFTEEHTDQHETSADHNKRNPDEDSKHISNISTTTVTNEIKTILQQNLAKMDSSISESIVKQIVDEIRFTAKPEMKSLELQLEPESLGKVSLTVASKSGVVTAQIVAQNEVAKEAIESQIANLREAMNNQGIKIEAIEVTLASHQFEQNLSKDGESHHQNRSKSRKHISEKELAEINGIIQDKVVDDNLMEQMGNTVSYIA